MQTCCHITGLMDPLRPNQGIGDLAQQGIFHGFLDLSLFCNPWMTKDKIEEPWLEYFLRMVREFLGRCGGRMKWAACCAPVTSSGDFLTYLEQEKVVEAAIDLCGEMGCPYLVVPPLDLGGSLLEQFAHNRPYYLRLGQIAWEQGVTILLENQFRDFNGHLVRGVCSNPSQAVQWVDELNRIVGREQFGFSLNTGSCTICRQGIQPFVLALGHRLKLVRLRDTPPDQEHSMLPFTAVGQWCAHTDWTGLILGLRSIRFHGILAMDGWETASVYSPLLRPQLVGLIRSTLDYLQFQIELEEKLSSYSQIVLFGAGNMCHNYMKYYGKQYPPLFTCDNNQTLWGSTVCGLEVKPPKALLDLPADCTILLCNVYYREIHTQLVEMGVQCPVAYFNDEYLPDHLLDEKEITTDG